MDLSVNDLKKLALSPKELIQKRDNEKKYTAAHRYQSPSKIVQRSPPSTPNNVKKWGVQDEIDFEKELDQWESKENKEPAAKVETPNAICKTTPAKVLSNSKTSTPKKSGNLAEIVQDQSARITRLERQNNEKNRQIESLTQKLEAADAKIEVLFDILADIKDYAQTQLE